MSRLVSSVTSSRLVSAIAFAAFTGCANPTAPTDDNQETLHEVSVTFESLTVLGSCDHNSIFESKDDGEFDVKVTLADAGANRMEFSRNVSATLTEATHRLNPTLWSVVVLRDVSRSVGLRVHVWASERDGLLGNDSAMSDRNLWMTHQWNGTSWTGGRTIDLVGSSQCGVRLRYSITSAPVE
jgi:hypothetical protein